MKGPLFAISAAAVIALCAPPAFADHNSKQGEGWANMPNDIHNTRVETLDANDNEAFRDFVKYGEGSESVNRFDSDDTAAHRAKEQKGKAATEQAQAQQQAGSRKNQQVKEQRRIRPEGAPGASERQRSMRERDNTGYRAERQGMDRQRSRGGRGRN
jgi:hypothetical protein